MAFSEIETSRLCLRPFHPEDFEAVQAYAGCEENTLYVEWGPNAPEDTVAFLRAVIREATSLHCKDYQFAAQRRDNARVIGAVSLSLQEENQGELGWIVHRDFWRQGYATEMGQAILKFGFETLGLRRIIAHCDTENEGSWRVMEKLGLRREGCFLQSRPAAKRSERPYSDDFSYAMLREEFCG